MCFSVSVGKKVDYLRERFGASFPEQENFQSLYHASAFTIPSIPVICNDDPGEIRLYKWGLVPHWVKDEKYAGNIRFKTFNARAETLYEKPSFRDPIQEKRCIVIVDGFYEWRHLHGNKYPYHIRLHGAGAFALAGIWDRWVHGGTELNTFSIITTRANPLLEKIHNSKKRMPVILKREDEKTWLGGDLERASVESFLVPYDGELHSHTVSKLVSGRGVNSNVPEVQDEYVYPELEREQTTLFERKC